MKIARLKIADVNDWNGEWRNDLKDSYNPFFTAASNSS